MSGAVYEPQKAELVSYGTPDYDNYSSPLSSAETQEVSEPTSQEPSAAQETPTIEPQQTEVVPDAAPEVEVSDQERIFKEMFEKTFGMAPEELRSELESTRVEKQRIEAERQLTQLQTEWGVDEVTLSERLELINQRLGKLPEGARQALDNYEGINLIWNAIRAEMPQGEALPRYEKSSVASGANAQRPMFTKAQLASMSTEEYRKNNDAILYAYQNNLIQ
jgi:hypothetical protein